MFELYVQGGYRNTRRTIRDCHRILAREYRRCDDTYHDELFWAIFDQERGKVVSVSMPGGIWDACCESPSALESYLQMQEWQHVIGDPGRVFPVPLSPLGNGSE